MFGILHHGKKIQSLNFHSLNYGETLYRLVSSNDYIFSVDELGNLALWDINLNTDTPIATNSVEVDQDEVAAMTDSEFEFEDVQFRTVGNTKLQTVSEQQKNISEMNKELFIDLRKGTGTTIISSAGGVEFAFESSAWNNGLFTFCLLNNLKNRKADLNNDEVVRISEHRKTVQEEVYNLSNGFQRPTSRLDNIQSDFIIWNY